MDWLKERWCRVLTVFDMLVWMRIKSWLIRNIFISCRFIKLASTSWNHIINFTFSRLIKISSGKVLFVNDRCRDYGIYDIRRFWLASWFIRLLVISYTQKTRREDENIKLIQSRLHFTLLLDFNIIVLLSLFLLLLRSIILLSIYYCVYPLLRCEEQVWLEARSRQSQ